MKKKFPLVALLAASAFVVTGCDGAEISQEKAEAKLAKAQENVEASQGYEFNLTTNVEATVGVTSGEESATSKAQIGATAKAGILFNEDKSAIDKAYIDATSTGTAYVNGEKTASFDAGAQYFLTDGYLLTNALSNGTSVEKYKTAISSTTTATFAGEISAPGFNASCELDLNELISSLAEDYGANVSYHESLGKVTYVYELDDATVKASLESTISDESSAYMTALLANMEFKNCYVKFAFNEKATKLSLDVNMEAHAKYSVSAAGYTASASLDFTASTKVTYNLVSSLSETFPSASTWGE